MISNKILRLKQRVPKQHEENITIWTNAMENGLPPFPKPIAHNTIRIYLSSFVNHILKGLNQDLSNLLDVVELAIAKCRREQYSLKKDILCAAKSFAKYMIKKEKLDRKILDDLNEYKLKRIQKAHQPVVKLEEVEKLLDLIKNKLIYKSKYNRQLDGIIIRTSFYTGMRISELVNLKVEDIHFDEKRISIINSKGGKSRVIGINNELQPHLQKYINKVRPESKLSKAFLLSDGNELTLDRIEKRIKRVTKAAGLNGGLHQFRRGMITHYANKGVSVTHLQIVAGHSDFQTTMGYYHPDKEEILNKQVNW